MNPQMAGPPQAQHQSHVPQSQNISQQRQGPSTVQHQYAATPQKGNSGQQPLQTQYANYDPQLALFSLEKAKDVQSWEDVVPEQQHVGFQELQNELIKFRRNRGNVKRVLDKIPSLNCRRIINELVEDQNNTLWEHNRSIQYRIASVELDWYSLNRRQHRLKRVQVILETEPSGFQQPPQMKVGPVGAGAGASSQDTAKVMKQGSVPQNPQGQGQPNAHAQNVGHQPKHNHQQPAQQMAQSQQFEQHPVRPQPQPGPAQGQNHAHANAPPPPPPPGSGGQPGIGALPPPPPGVGHNMHAAPMQHTHMQNIPPHARGAIPGAFPEPMPMPMHGMRQGHGIPYGGMDPELLRKQKKHKHNRGSASSASSSSSSSSSDSDYETESGSSGTGSVRVLNVERGDYRLVDRRENGHSLHSKKSKKSHKHKSQGRVHSRSRSRSQTRKGNESYNEKASRKRRNSDMIDPPPIGKHIPGPSKANSTHMSHNQPHGQLPTPVHIHLNTNNSSDEKERDQGRFRERHISASPPPAGFYKDPRKFEKMNTAQPMSRESSWDRGSGTASFTASSAYTNEDVVFDKPIRRPSLSRGHSRTKSYPHPQANLHHFHSNHIYDDEDRHARVRHVAADDYPHNPITTPRTRDSYFGEQPTYNPRVELPHREDTMYTSRPPLPHRRASVQANPFATSHFPPKPTRAMTYAPEMHEPAYSYPPQRHIEQAERDEKFDLRDMVDAFQHIKESRRVAAPPLQRRATDRRDSGMYTGDEWDMRHSSPRYESFRY